MADQNLIDSDALARVQDIEFVHQFEQGVTQLLAVLDIAEPQVLTAGTQVQMYEVTGNLASGKVAEGDDIPLSKYAQTKGVAYSVDLEEYRKATSAQSILKFGFDAAVTKTDRKMLRDIQGAIRRKFFDFLAQGTGTATGANFQQAFAMAWGTLANTLSEMDTDGTPIYFANPLDLATYLGAATINNVETAFGFTYLRNFLSLGTCVFDAKVPRGTVYATLTENINCYAVDLTELAKGGLAFEVSDETGLIGVHHTGRYSNGTAETYADTGLLLFPEVANYIVRATIEDGSRAREDGGAQAEAPALSQLSVGSLALQPAFDPRVTSYTVTTTNATNTVTATPADEGATVAIAYPAQGGQEYQSGTAVTWQAGTHDMAVTVSSGGAQTTYVVSVTKE